MTHCRVGSFRAGRHGDLYAQTSHAAGCSGSNSTLIIMGSVTCEPIQKRAKQMADGESVVIP
jgi:hypothetical protein